MSQFARPNADSYRSGWEEDDGSTTNLYDQIDEAVVDDDDYIRSPLAPSSAHTMVFKLSSLNDPVSSSGHVLRYRYAKDASAGATVNLAVQIRQSWQSTSELGTLISHATHSDISHAVTDGTLSLSASEADAITDYTDLYVMLIPSQDA